MLDEKAILHAMKALDISRKEAIEMLQEDADIDRGADPHPLTEEQKQTEKKMRQADRKPFVPNLTPRERKADEMKRALIVGLSDWLTTNNSFVINDCEITNKERQIDFSIDGRRLRIVLSAPRK